MFGRGKADESAENSNETLAQEVMPLESIQGPFLRLPNSESVLVLSIMGSNDSLFTHEQKMDLSRRFASCLRTLNKPAQIIVIPKPVDSNASLVRIDSELAELNDRIFEEDNPVKLESLKMRERLLSVHMRPEAEMEALAGDRIEYATYIEVKYGKHDDDSSALHHIRTLSDSLAQEGFEPKLLNTSELIELLQLYFMPHGVDNTAIFGRMPVLADTQSTERMRRRKPARKLNAQRGGRRRAEKKADTAKVRDALLLSAVSPDMIEHRTCLEVGESVARTVTFNRFKTMNAYGWADFLFGHTDMSVCLRLDPVSINDLQDSIDMHEKQLGERAMTSRRMSASEKDELEREMRHGTKILEMVGDEGERFFNATMSAVIRRPSIEELDRTEANLRSNAGSNGMNFIAIPNNQLEGFMACSPLFASDSTASDRCARPFPASTVGHANLAREAGLDDQMGIVIGHDTHNGRVALNILETSERRHNRNIIVVGQSGAGKTVLMQQILLKEYLQFGSKVIIVDPEGQFSKLVRALGGHVINLSTASGSMIAPTEPRAVVIDDANDDDPSSDRDEDEKAREQLVLASTMPFVKSWFSRACGIAGSQLDLFDEVLEETYGKYGITVSTTFEEYSKQKLSYPLVRDIYDTIAKMAASDPERASELKALGQKIRPMAIGATSQMWNTRSNISIEDDDIVCLNTEGLGSDERIQQAQYFNVLTWIWSEIRLAPKEQRGVRLVLDESQTIVNEEFPEAARMVNDIVRRIRKRFGGTTIGTQDLSAWLADTVYKYGAGICNNATYKFVGFSDSEAADKIASIFKLPGEVKKELEHLRQGNFALIAGVDDRTYVHLDVPDWMWPLFGAKPAKEES